MPDIGECLCSYLLVQRGSAKMRGCTCWGPLAAATSRCRVGSIARRVARSRWIHDGKRDVEGT